MRVWKEEDWQFLSHVADLAYTNPFLPERPHCERAALGRLYRDSGPVWSATVEDPEHLRQNAWRIQERAEALFADPPPIGQLSQERRRVYWEAAQHTLYQRYFAPIYANYRQLVAGRQASESPQALRWDFYPNYLADYRKLLGGLREAEGGEAHLFACFWQINRAFHLIYDHIIGGSMAAAELRATVWQSIFTADLRAYARFFFRQMGDFPTLITGPSGTGKELVAKAIAGSRYLAFDSQQRQFTRAGAPFLPVNLAALPATLVESELFGHRKGAFTGAIADRKGWLATCPATGTVFLDEIGELEMAIQVKLLRLLESREFSAVGETQLQRFSGKLVAATNRNLAEGIRQGAFREDLYYRLCADQIQTPSLAAQWHEAGAAQVQEELLLYMCRKNTGDLQEAQQALPKVKAWMRQHLPKRYNWPGNYRELEQCVRNILIRGSYRPLPRNDSGDPFWNQATQGTLTAQELLQGYVQRVYAQCHSYEETARRTGLDRRTVKAKITSTVALS